MTGEPGVKIPGIDKDLDTVFAGIEALHKLAARQNPPKANLRLSQISARLYDFIRWGVLMSGRLMRLEHYYRAGKLTGGQEWRYRELRRELEDVTPLIERLGVSWPTVPLED